MTYSVKIYKKNGKLWKTVKNVDGDLISSTRLPDNSTRLIGTRTIILKDQSRIEVPLDWPVVYSRDRFLSIKQRMEAEAGQKLAFRPDVNTGN